MAGELTSVLFVDSSILDEILEIPGWCDQSLAIRAEFETRTLGGVRMVIPISAVIETGNHIAQCAGDRRRAAHRYARLLDQLIDGSAPWRVNETDWNLDLLSQIRSGAHTKRDLVDLLSNRVMGGGDLAILAEAGRMRQTSFGLKIDLWTKDAKFSAHWPFGETV